MILHTHSRGGGCLVEAMRAFVCVCVQIDGRIVIEAESPVARASSSCTRAASRPACISVPFESGGRRSSLCALSLSSLYSLSAVCRQSSKQLLIIDCAITTLLLSISVRCWLDFLAGELLSGESALRKSCASVRCVAAAVGIAREWDCKRVAWTFLSSPNSWHSSWSLPLLGALFGTLYEQLTAQRKLTLRAR